MSISTNNLNELLKSHSRPIHFIFLDFAGDPLYACTGTKSYSFDGQTWLGIGEVAGISDVAEMADAAARGVSFTLSGVDSWIVTPALNRQNYKYRAAKIYRGQLDANEDLVDDPWLVWSGRMDVGSMTYDRKTASAQMDCEPDAARLLRANMSRYSNEDHQLRHSGDAFYEFLAQMEKKDAVWGGSRVSPGMGGGGGSKRVSSSNPRSQYH